MCVARQDFSDLLCIYKTLVLVIEFTFWKKCSLALVFWSELIYCTYTQLKIV